MVKNLPPQPGWEESWGRTDTRICVAETLHYLPETITTLLIGYTPIKNKKLKKKKGICLPIQEMLFPFLVGELRSEMPRGHLSLHTAITEPSSETSQVRLGRPCVPQLRPNTDKLINE